MIKKIADTIFKVKFAKVKPTVIASLIVVAGFKGITVLCHKLNNEIDYKYDKKVKDDTSERTKKDYKDMQELKKSYQSNV